MILALLTTALAGTSFTVSGGAAFARGTDWGTYPPVGYSTLGPVVSGAYNWRFGPIHTFAGGSFTGVMASSGLEAYPVSVVSADFGLGLGTRAFGVGVYGGWGFPRSLGGLYTQVTAPTDQGRMGGELRFFSTGREDLDGVAVLFRWEPDIKPHRRPPPPPAPPPPPPPLYSEPPYSG